MLLALLPGWTASAGGVHWRCCNRTAGHQGGVEMFTNVWEMHIAQNHWRLYTNWYLLYTVRKLIYLIVSIQWCSFLLSLAPYFFQPYPNKSTNEVADEFWAQKLLEGIAPRLRVCSPASLDVRSTHDLIFGDSAGLADHGHSVKRCGSLAILIHFVTFPVHDWRGINTVDWNNQWCKQKAIVVGQVNLIDTPALEQLSNELRILGVWLDKMVSYPKADGRFVWSFGSDVSIKYPPGN